MNKCMTKLINSICPRLEMRLLTPNVHRSISTKGKLRLWEQQHEDELAVVTFCRSGKHRSVAWGRILLYILRHAHGYCVPGAPEHMNQRAWTRLCTSCHDCSEMTSEKRDALETALKIYKE